MHTLQDTESEKYMATFLLHVPPWYSVYSMFVLVEGLNFW
jgi:hypothetical protein